MLRAFTSSTTALQFYAVPTLLSGYELMKIWVIKQFIMTRYFILTATFLAFFLARPVSIMAKKNTAFAATISENNGADKPLKSSTETPMKAAPIHQDKKPHGTAGKSHTPTMDETAHIHRFHKERVKKIKKHHAKFWLLTKVLLILCHLALLVIAYLHATH